MQPWVWERRPSTGITPRLIWLKSIILLWVCPFILCWSAQTNICIVLHPRHKLEYFKGTGWKPRWIEIAEDLVHHKFERSYSSIPVVSDAEGEEMDVEDVTNTQVRFNRLSFWHLLINDYFFCQTKPKNIFDDLPALKAPTKAAAVVDELCLYLSSPPEHVEDPIRWWYEKRLLYLWPHRMALDYLCIPSKN